jgi:hypothetical protein
LGLIALGYSGWWGAAVSTEYTVIDQTIGWKRLIQYESELYGSTNSLGLPTSPIGSQR